MATTTKSKSPVAELPPAQDSLPTVSAPEVEVVTDLSVLNKAPSVRIVSAKVMETNSNKLAEKVADCLVNGRDYTLAIDAAAREMRAFRLMFPAPEATRRLLGENTPDLGGQTNEYKNTWGKVQTAGREMAVERFVALGLTQDAAERSAIDEAEKFRKSVSRRFRLNVEAEARKLGPLGAKYLLAHGFERNGECGPKQILTKGAKLILPEVPEGTPVSIADAIVQLPTIAPTTTPPAEPADQAKPGETADSVEAERMGDGVLNPFALINEAVGMLNRAASLLAETKSTIKERNAARAALVSAAQNVSSALGSN